MCNTFTVERYVTVELRWSLFCFCQPKNGVGVKSAQNISKFKFEGKTVSHEHNNAFILFFRLKV